MDATETHSTSSQTAKCTPIELRPGEQVRLVFVPTLVDNPSNPKAGVRGEFVYQRKAKNQEWQPVETLSLGSIKKEEAYKLALHAGELLTLVEGLGPLYRLVWGQGVPQGKNTFVKVEKGLTRFLELGEADLKSFLDAHADGAATTLSRLLRWLTSSPKLHEVLGELANIAPADLPPMSTLMGVAALKSALTDWQAHSSESSEEYWQETLSARAFVLSQVFSYPVLVLKEKAYLGGKAFTNQGGGVTDFLLKATSTGALLIVEIKTPTTKLLAKEYRPGVFPPSEEISGAVAQAIHYRQKLLKN